MKLVGFVCSLCLICGLCFAGNLFAQGDTLTIAINFAADEPVEPPPGIGSEVDGVAGILGSQNWNNFELLAGLAGDLIDSNGNETTASVIWESNNTWASAPVDGQGRSENNIEDSVGLTNDRFLMTGYLDSNDNPDVCPPELRHPEIPELGGMDPWCGANRITVGGLPFGDNPYEIIVYANGGVTNRGGYYYLNNRDRVGFHDVAPFNGTFDLSSEERNIDGETVTVWTGDVMIFSDVIGDSFIIESHADDFGGTTAGFRTLFNAIEITGEIPGSGPDCDFNADSLCNIVDIDQLMNDAETGGTNSDMNMDGVVNDDDRDLWLASAGPENGFAGAFLVGDSDLNGKVEAPDLNEVGIAWQNAAVFNWSNGNYTSAGQPGVNVNDLNELGLRWQQEVALAGAANAVPEPAGMTLLLVGLYGLFVLRRR